MPAEQPYLLAYTSGTTGRPKGALHVQGGFLLSIAREAAYQSDIRAGDRVLFATDMGWIMGPWTVVGAGALGAAVVYMEGAPDWPDDRIWRLVETERVTMLGVSPTLVRALIPKGEPETDLTSLRAITTTGEPWNAGPYDWLNEHAAGGGRIPIVNISGGTEVGACFLSVTPMAPTKPCSLGFPALGQAMDVFSPEGTSLREEVGELVCTRAWPGMTRGIWGDDARYLETYWSRFPGVWTHGDWASIDEDGYWSLHGRSDDTLNIAGKRIGPAELESAALDHPAVAEAAAVGIPHEVKGEVAWLFCGLRPGAEGRCGRSQGRSSGPRSARRSCRSAFSSSARFRRLAAPRSSGGPSGRPRSARIPATSRPWRTPRPWRRSRMPSRALVTGGGRGIGAGIARELARAGWHVTVTGRTQEQVEEVAREIGGEAVAGDVSRKEDVERMLAVAEPIDLLVANAGVALWEDSWETDPDEWWHVFEVNVLGAYLTCRLALPGHDRARRRPDRDHGERRVVSSRA